MKPHASSAHWPGSHEVQISDSCSTAPSSFPCASLTLPLSVGWREVKNSLKLTEVKKKGSRILPEVVDKNPLMQIMKEWLKKRNLSRVVVKIPGRNVPVAYPWRIHHHFQTHSYLHLVHM